MAIGCIVQLTQDATNDLLDLSEEVFNEYLEVEEKLQKNIHLGQALEHKNGKDLSDCFKIYFNNYKYRIVYRKRQNNYEVIGIQKVSKSIAEVIAVGKRDKERVYIEACNRLGR